MPQRVQSPREHESTRRWTLAETANNRKRAYEARHAHDSGAVMSDLAGRLAVASQIAAESEGDTRLKKLLRAVIIWPAVNCRDVTAISTRSHRRNFYWLVFPSELKELRMRSEAELAERLPAWIKSAAKTHCTSELRQGARRRASNRQRPRHTTADFLASISARGAGWHSAAAR